jgi:hypothetical protein
VTHHAQELVTNGIAMGVLGAIALLAFRFARRGGRLYGFAVMPPVGIVAAIGATGFALAAAIQLESGAARLRSGAHWGAGWTLVADLAALPALLACTGVLLRELRLLAARA